MNNEHRKSARQWLRFTTKEAAADNPQHLEQGLELVARLLLERWQKKHTVKNSGREGSH